MRALLALVATALLAGLLVTAPATTAEAQTKTRRVAAGDADPTYDLQAATVRNGRRQLVVRLRVADVRRRQTGAVLFFSRPRDDDGGFLAEVAPTRRGTWRVSLARFTGDDVTDVRCARLRSTVRAGRLGHLRLVVPQRCLGDGARRLSVSGWTYGRQGPLTDDPDLADDADAAFDLTVRRG